MKGMDFLSGKFAEIGTVFQKCDLTLAIISVSLLFLMMNPSITDAQTSRLQVGDRIRLTAPVIDSKRIKGTVMEIDKSVLVLSVKDSTFYVSESLIQNMETSTGKRRVIKKGLLLGAFTGTLTFGLLSVFTNNSCGFEEDCIFPNRNGDAFLRGATSGVIVGGTAGAIAGFFIKMDIWERIPVSVAMDLTQVSSTINPRAIEPKISVRLSLD